MLVKVVLLGDSGTGKSCLLKQLCENKFDDGHVSTIGVDFGVRTIQLDSTVAKLQIWDTAGQDRFRSITASYYRGADTILLVFDVCNVESFENVWMWYQEATRFAKDDATIVLVANKIDMNEKRKVSAADIKGMLAKLNTTHCIETSAKTSKNVLEAFVLGASEYVKSARGNRKLSASEKQQFLLRPGKPVDDKAVVCPSCTIL